MNFETVLSQVFDTVGDAMGSVGRGIERSITSLFGSSNARYVRKLQPIVSAVNALEPKFQAMSDAELREQTFKFRKRLAAGETLDDLVVEAFAVCREGGRRVLKMRHFDVQLMGGTVLHRGNIAEMVTGEGKTLVATLPAYLNALEGKGVHVVTVNDYLARRDMEWMGPLYMSLGLTVGAIQANMPNDDRQVAYECDITYGTNNEFGFDYLRDNMRWGIKGDRYVAAEMQQVQRGLHFAIIDEVDNILIDEARTPLIISGPAHDDVTRYTKADKIARQLKKGVHFEVNEKEHSAHLTDEGVRAAEHIAGVESFYTAGNMEWPHLIDNALKAHYLYKRDVNYVVQGDEIIIVDEFTGRLMHGRNWSDGLHQAVEAKEGVRVKEENQTLATITLQNFFKLYKKICGMTGTAMTEAGEFWKIYKLDVIAIPTNKELHRINHPDVIYRTEEEKYEAIVHEIERLHKWDVLRVEGNDELWGTIVKEDEASFDFLPQGEKQKERVPKSRVKETRRKGRPILVGTVSIERSELISEMLNRRGVKHEVLNAKHHQREAEIIAQAGRKGAVTIATNMAGRGTDIILGGNPEAAAWAQLQVKYANRLEVPKEEWDTLVREIEQREGMKAEGREVASMGGLHIIGTERHEARRIDLQLRGRSGRQGDPGSSRFYLSLEDDLMRIFAGEWVKNVLTRLGMQHGEAIESRMVSRRIEGAQKKVEERNFDIRKHLLEYDEVMDEQRKRVYGYRQNILSGANCKELIFKMVDEQVDRYVDGFFDRDFGTESFAHWAGKLLSVELEPRDFRGMDFAMAQRYALDQAERMAEGQIFELVEENLPDEADENEWNWEAMAHALNIRWQLSLRDRDLKRVGRDDLVEFVLEKVQGAVQKVDLSGGAYLLEPDLGLRTALGWVKGKFGFEIPPEQAKGLEREAFKEQVRSRAREAYSQKEAEYPVMAGMYHFSLPDGQGHRRYDREGLIAWAKSRFGIDIELDDIRNLQRDEIRVILAEHSRRYAAGATEALAEVEARVEELLEEVPEGSTSLRALGENGHLRSLSTWLREQLNVPLTPEELSEMEPEELRRTLQMAVEERFRPEMRRMERSLLLSLLDAAWKDHLLAMDHLRSSVGLRGYAQVDPKVEFKREGMRIFEQMWASVGERVTDLVFRIDRLDERFVGSTWKQAEARHDSAPNTTTEIGRQQQEAIDGTQTDHKPQPIRNRGERVGRNDPCPCGSGKKYKACCMKKG